MHNILIKPLVTEKMTELMERENKYGFVVDYNTNKIEGSKLTEDETRYIFETNTLIDKI